MGKWTLGLLDGDKEYLESLMAYYSGGDVGKPFRLISFSELVFLEAHVRIGGKLDILLVDSSQLPREGGFSELAHLVAELGDEHSLQSELGIAFIQKYQPLDKLTAKLLSMCLERNPSREVMASRQDGKVVAVYSASGGVGKTTVACNVARALSYFGKKVFMLTLESYQTPSPFQSETKDDAYSRLLYYLRADPASLSTRLQTLKSIDHESKLDYMQPLQQNGDMELLTGEATRTLIQSLLTIGYDYVVVDLNSSLHERILAAIKESHLLLWLITDDAGCLSRTQQAARYLDQLNVEEEALASKTKYVVNRYTGVLVNEFAAYDINSYECLPYIPAWKSVSNMAQLLTEPVIQHTLAGIIREYFSGQEEKES